MFKLFFFTLSMVWFGCIGPKSVFGKRGVHGG
jgi:hypothetical protein